MISGFFLTGGPGELNSGLRCDMHEIFDLKYISAELTRKWDMCEYEKGK